MMLAKSLQSAAGNAAEANYIEDVFSTYLYTGNSSTQTITNGIDLAGEGGLVWIKNRTDTDFHNIFDTNRGAGKVIFSNDTSAESSQISRLSSFTSSGFTLGDQNQVNESGFNYASWTFRKQPKFFDVVTYTGNGTPNRAIAHSLASVPGSIFIKRLDTARNWAVYHRSTTAYDYSLRLNTTDAQFQDNYFSAAPDATSFFIDKSPGGDLNVNASGGTYVAYLFAHDAGGFGESGTDNVISCGSYTGTGSSDGTNIVNLGFEPQFILVKNASSTSDWRVIDAVRGTGNAGLGGAQLSPNLSSAETGTDGSWFTSTGFVLKAINAEWNASGNTYIYIAIRRGPMKVPTTGTSVFQPVAYTGTNVDNRLVNTGIVTDMTMARIRTATSTGGFYTADRLRGNASLGTATTDVENTDADSFMTPTVGYGNSFSAMNGFGVGNDATRQLNQSSTSQLAYAFKRAAGFFDVVCYTGTGVARTVAHNLGVAPELMIVKARSGGSTDWAIYSKSLASAQYLVFRNPAADTNDAVFGFGFPSATSFNVDRSDNSNYSGYTYVAYLFATCPGVSKVGSYTGTGATQVINCGFTAGARFVMIKRTDSTGDWYVWDTARGIVAGNDPYLLLNSTAAEVTSADYIDPVSSGFEISSTAPAAINASGGSFIFLAIA